MKKIVFILMIFLLISSWYFVLSNGNQKIETYKECIDKANVYCRKEIYIDAIDCYKKAIVLCPDKLDDKVKLAMLYKRAKMYTSFENYCISLVEKYKNNEELIVMIGDYYVEIGKEKKAIAWYRDNIIENKDSELICKKLDELRLVFSIDYNSYSYISDFYNGYAVFKRDDKYGIMDDRGNVIIQPIYDDAGIFDKNNKLILAPVLLDGQYFYIDVEGNKRLVSDVDYDYIGSFADSGLAVVKKNNKYGYIDRMFNEKNIIYDYASAFSDSGTAIVKSNGEWFLINEKFEVINDKRYDDVKIDDLDCAVHSNIIYVKKDDKYMMLDAKGNEITKPIFEDADYFVTLNEPAAIKINDKWGFVDIGGNIVIEPKYENAFSFSCGLAPVQVDGLWGYIDKQDKLAIKPQFKMARSFNSCGVAPILKTEWQLISLEYYK